MSEQRPAMAKTRCQARITVPHLNSIVERQCMRKATLDSLFPNGRFTKCCQHSATAEARRGPPLTPYETRCRNRRILRARKELVEEIDSLLRARGPGAAVVLYSLPKPWVDRWRDLVKRAKQ